MYVTSEKGETKGITERERTLTKCSTMAKNRPGQKVITAWIDAELKDELNRIAEARSVTLTEMLNEKLQTYLDKEKLDAIKRKKQK